MKPNAKWKDITAVTLIVTSLLIAGCASQPSSPAPTLEQRIATASTPFDHEQIALLYEQQANIDNDASARHTRMARSYAQGLRNAAPGMAAHCEGLAAKYRAAADENLELARMHRQMVRFLLQ